MASRGNPRLFQVSMFEGEKIEFPWFDFANIWICDRLKYILSF